MFQKASVFETVSFDIKSRTLAKPRRRKADGEDTSGQAADTAADDIELFEESDVENAVTQSSSTRPSPPPIPAMGARCCETSQFLIYTVA